MLRNLRSRRRPRYGAFICAVVAAMLLLLSVSLLQTRLSHSHPHFHHHLLHRNRRPVHDVNYDSLLSDSVNEETPGTEDSIDALDIVEEQPQEDDEAEDEPFDQIRVAGYFFDHVGGVIRRAFGRGSIEEWDDGQIGVLMGSGGMEDPGKTAFGSDDLPVDEQVRRKAIQVMGIEDALLLKMGRRVSPLREGWGDWFDKKVDFLRKDKMLRSNLEILNPLHNPILQDPNGVGVTGLTKSDRIVHRSLLNEFKRVPFLGKTALSIPRQTEEPKLQGNHGEAKVKERGSNVGI